ncbi:hypothetical protein [Metabacillus indicus]|uniref:hypothetical protein n=1 Tax=Metabacillus indicus TaxID=246786 RepID=UPI000493159C|nr:hypothetical protein [Metabacillus indicus]KEZ50904.1 hypothetical protein AZ46_0209760 [Metabacillus indicus LMG 22858]
MNKEVSYCDQLLQKLDDQVEWSPHRAQMVRRKLMKNIKKTNVMLRLQRIYTFSISSVLAALFLFVMAGQISGQLNLAGTGDHSIGNSKFIEGVHYQIETINGLKTAVLTTKGIENTVYPTNANETIKTIAGEPEIHLSISKQGKEEVFETQAIYPSTTPGQHIYIVTQRHNEPIDTRMKMLLPLTKYPSSSHSAYELKISGHRAVMQEEKTGIGKTDLYVVTENYIYHIYSAGMSKKDSRIDPQELIRLADLLQFEKE